MKRVLLDKNKSFYKANLHCHSTNSDGRMTPNEIKEHYKNNGYSVIAITDHEHLIDYSYLNDSDFLTITSCELAVKEIENMSTSVKHDMKVAHFNIYAFDPANINTPCYNYVLDKYVNDRIKKLIYQPPETYKREYNADAINRIIETANNEGFLVSYNHPRWSLENACDYLKYNGLWAVEIYNHETNFAGLYEYDINVYDDFLRNGHNMACTACDDCHGINTTLGGYVMINAEKLDYNTIMSALSNHCFYSSTGPVIEELYIENDRAYLTYKNGCYATMSTKGRRVEKFISADTDGENTAVFNILADKDGYVRFDVVDSHGARANTNAYLI